MSPNQNLKRLARIVLPVIAGLAAFPAFATYPVACPDNSLQLLNAAARCPSEFAQAAREGFFADVSRKSSPAGDETIAIHIKTGSFPATPREVGYLVIEAKRRKGPQPADGDLRKWSCQIIRPVHAQVPAAVDSSGADESSASSAQ